MDKALDQALEEQAYYNSPLSIEQHDKQIRAELKRGGAVKYNLWLPETHYLKKIIQPGEHIMAAVYGRYDKGGTNKGRGALVATDQRVLFVDKKPSFFHADELTFDIVSGVTRTNIGFIGTLTLHTREGDYKLRTFNQKNSRNFAEYISLKCLQGRDK